MGKKWGWFYAVKKAFSSHADPTKISADKKDSRSRKSKRKWFGRYNSSTSSTSEQVYNPSEQENKLVPGTAASSPPCVYHDVPVELEDDNSIDNDNGGHTYTSVALATAAAAAQAAAEAVWHSVTRFSGKSKEDTAAIRIQATFRGYAARKVFRAMKRLGRLKKLVQGHYVSKQASTTLRCMQTLARVQSQIRSRRIRMSEENQVLHKQRQQKRDRDIVGGDSWNASPRSKEQMEARLQRRQEASLRRERALAYAFSHQKSLRNKFLNPLIEPNSSIWGWSWLERWMATRPWDSIQSSYSSYDVDKQQRGGIIKTTTSPRGPSSSNPKRPTAIKKYHSLSCAPSLVSWGKGNKVVNEEETKQQPNSRIRRHSITGFSLRRASSSTSIDMDYQKSSTASAGSTRKTRSRPASPLSSSSSSIKNPPTSFLPSPITSRRHSGFPTGTTF